MQGDGGFDEGGVAPIRLLSVVGTRPEAIKMAPVAIAAARHSAFAHRLVATGQHGAPCDNALAEFGVVADVQLPPTPYDTDPDVMVGRFAAALVPILTAERPDIVLVQGDTTSAYAAALAADRLDIAVGHVEAGLRSFDFAQPWPEERNRVAIDRIARLLFAPTPGAQANLLHDEDVTGRVVITGNTGIDALLLMCERLPPASAPDVGAPALILLTCHRRESIGAGIEAICVAALRLADREDVRILCPVHPNRAIGDTVRTRLADHPRIMLTDALSYRETVSMMRAARIILTDSGGIQEEAPALGVPALVLRDKTERPEGLASRNLALVGTDPVRILAAATRLIDDPSAHAAMAHPAFPFGRGGAAEKILDGIQHYFSQPADALPSLPFSPVSTMDARSEGA